MAILVDTSLCALNKKHKTHCQLLHGAAWRPPQTTIEDASDNAPLFKRLYYRYQIARHGDKVSAAAGDHLNLSLPWFDQLGDAEVTRKIIEMTARMRLLTGALSIALTASSPLYFGSTGQNHAQYGTALTPWESARLGHVWPGRTIMDVSGLYRDNVRFRRTMHRFADTGTLLSGRDIWLITRAQPGCFTPGKTFEDLCAEMGLDEHSDEGIADISQLLYACFDYGPRNPDNPFRNDPRWSKMETWRQDLLDRVIHAPRNRVEIRTLETPPAFSKDTPGGDYLTAYEWLRSVHTFFEILFIYLSEVPRFVEDLEYGELELQAAKANEQKAISLGLDAKIRWIPSGMHTMAARDVLDHLLTQIEPLSRAMGRHDELELVRRAAKGDLLPPAARIRLETQHHYGIDASTRHNAQLLPDDSYPKMLLSRNRAAMSLELNQIESDIKTLPKLDQSSIQNLVTLVRKLRVS